MHLSSSAELRAFDATARSGSMSAAARLLGIRQPTVSAHIASLEQNFGVELFQRHGRRIVLTGFGKQLHEITQRIYRGEEQAAALLLAARQGYEGMLQIGAIGPYNAMPMIKRFRKQNPTVRVVVAVGDSRVVVHRVLDQKDDIGILLHAVDDERVHCLPFRKQALIVFAPTTHPLARGQKLTVRDLHGIEFVLREDGSQTRQVFESCLAAAGVKVRCSVEMGSREAVREAVAQGLGLGVVASTAFVPDSRVVELEVEGLNMHTHVHVICLRERKEATLIKGFLELVGELTPRTG
jgi:aminoethylphosphonate catabolism LysR family transcriptional regulator